MLGLEVQLGHVRFSQAMLGSWVQYSGQNGLVYQLEGIICFWGTLLSGSLAILTGPLWRFRQEREKAGFWRFRQPTELEGGAIWKNAPKPRKVTFYCIFMPHCGQKMRASLIFGTWGGSRVPPVRPPMATADPELCMALFFVLVGEHLAKEMRPKPLCLLLKWFLTKKELVFLQVQECEKSLNHTFT